MIRKPRVAVSSCLLGERVRYDGAEKGVPWITEELSTLVELIPVCPEVGAGMGVPRPPIRVVRRDKELALQVVGQGRDVSAAFETFSHSEVQRLQGLGLDGYLFKARSPSCGLRDTPHFASAQLEAEVVATDAGLWAARIRRELGSIVLADESEVADELGRSTFLQALRKHQQGRRAD